MGTFETDIPFDKRLAESTSIQKKYPTRLLVICEKHVSCTTLPSMDKRKFLVPRDLTFGQFMYVVRRRIRLDKDKAIFLTLRDGTMPASSSLLVDIASRHKHDDGFFYIFYTAENAFGSPNIVSDLHS